MTKPKYDSADVKVRRSEGKSFGNSGPRLVRRGGFRGSRDFRRKSPRHRAVAELLSQQLAFLQDIYGTRYVAFAEKNPGPAKDARVALAFF